MGRLLDVYGKEWPRVAAVRPRVRGVRRPRLLPGPGQHRGVQERAATQLAVQRELGDVRQRRLPCPVRAGDDRPRGHLARRAARPLGMFQAVAHGGMSIREAFKSPRRYSLGTITSVLLHLPIGPTYLGAFGPEDRSVATTGSKVAPSLPSSSSSVSGSRTSWPPTATAPSPSPPSSSAPAPKISAPTQQPPWPVNSSRRTDRRVCGTVPPGRRATR